jgi:outer membrane protein OmpA-like peptidoglycan-associated protein
VKQLLVVLVGLTGCAGSELAAKSGALRDVIKTARDNGAYKCAPRELAMAETHSDFVDQELREGDYYRARQEYDIADVNAKEALRKSPREQCATKVVVQPKQITVTALDSDGDGIPDNVDACPHDPEDFDGFQDADGCPDPDNDADGILDVNDKCPNEAEDRDGFQDADGCPDPDNDGDGIPDKADACPNEPEDKDGFQDADGCPDPDNDKDGVPDWKDKCPNEFAQTEDGCPKKYQLVVVTAQKIELKQTVYFDYNKATIKPISFALLNDVAQALKDNPGIHVRIEGHTDSRGDDNYNMKLSQSRAESVKKYLVDKGIPQDRMEPKGYGETVPIADNRTEEGRSQNRRVEFIIVGQ